MNGTFSTPPDDPEGAFVPPEFDVTGNTFEVSGSEEASAWPPSRAAGSPPEGLHGGHSLHGWAPATACIWPPAPHCAPGMLSECELTIFKMLKAPKITSGGWQESQLL